MNLRTYRLLNRTVDLAAEFPKSETPRLTFTIDTCAGICTIIYFRKGNAGDNPDLRTTFDLDGSTNEKWELALEFLTAEIKVYKSSYRRD